jgi:hypothetical protein
MVCRYDVSCSDKLEFIFRDLSDVEEMRPFELPHRVNLIRVEWKPLHGIPCAEAFASSIVESFDMKQCAVAYEVTQNFELRVHVAAEARLAIHSKLLMLGPCAMVGFMDRFTVKLWRMRKYMRRGFLLPIRPHLSRMVSKHVRQFLHAFKKRQADYSKCVCELEAAVVCIATGLVYKEISERTLQLRRMWRGVARCVFALVVSNRRWIARSRIPLLLGAGKTRPPPRTGGAIYVPTLPLLLGAGKTRPPPRSNAESDVKKWICSKCGRLNLESAHLPRTHHTTAHIPYLHGHDRTAHTTRG